MDIASLFGSAFQSPSILELSSDLVVPLSYPGGSNVSAVEGRFLSNESSWKELSADSFISAEEVLNSLCSISGNIRDMITVPLIVSHSNGKCRRVSIHNELGQKQNMPEVIHTFVPVTVVMGLLLLNLHKIEVSKRLLFAGLVRDSVELALDAYPRQGNDRHPCNDGQQHVHRVMDSNPNLDEFEESQNLKYKENYHTMRYLIPPNIARTDLRRMLADGVPQKIADRVWRKKALWLLCMHPSDIPKVHIADLRGKYDCFGLDIVELGAVWHILPRWEGGSPKAEWRRALKSRLDELVSKELAGKLSPSESRDAAYQGSEGLMIYDPDRTLYRQFGVSASAAGLQPGQRRNAVFTSVDLRLATVPQASKADTHPIPSSAYHSPNTDSEKEGESVGSTRHSSWARCGSARDMREDLILSDSEAGKRRTVTGARKKHRRKKKHAKGGDGRDTRQVPDPDSVRMAAIVPVSPLSGHLLEDRAADMDSPKAQNDEEKDDDECTDRDAELDELLNYEINLSCLDLDLDLADCLSMDGDSDLDSEDSCESEGLAEEDDVSWREVSEDVVDLHLDSETTTPGSKGVSPRSFPAPRAKHDLPTMGLHLNTDRTETTPRIENFRPFTTQVMMKKPMKRLNFIAAPAKTAESRQWLSNLDSSGQINFDATPDFVYDHGKKRSTRPAQKKAPTTPVSCAAKKAQGAGRVSTLPAWGSAGAKRKTAPSLSAAATPSRQSLSSLSSESSSPLELIYSQAAADQEMFDFNPQFFSSDPAVALPFDITAGQSSTNNAKLFESFKAISFQSSTAAINSENPYRTFGMSRSGSQESLTATDRSTGLTSLQTPEHEQGASAFERRSKQVKVTKSSSGTRDSADRSCKGGVGDSGVPMHTVDSIAGSLGKQTESASVFAFPTFSINSMQSAAKRLFAAPSKSPRSAGLVGSMESARAKEMLGASEKESEDETTGDGIIYDSPCQLSPLNDDTPYSEKDQDSSDGLRSNSLNVGSAWMTPKQSQKMVSVEDQHKLFSKTFTTQSPKMGRRISQEEELADNAIEAEIDNFIVPDELSPRALRQHGVVINLKEVNGIRQNALMSLPALLLEISRGSMNNSEDADEEGIEDMSENELGLWGDDADAGTESDQEEGIEEGDALTRSQCGEEGDSLDNIDRLVSGVENLTPPVKGILKGTRSNPQTEPRGCKTGADAVYWREDTETEGDFISEDTDSEGSTCASKTPPKSPLPSSAPAMPAGPVQLLTPEEAEDLILHKEARLAWLALETGALMVSVDFATALLLKLSQDSEAVTEPLETMVLLVDKLGADVNATDSDSMTPLHSLFNNPALGRFILSRGGDVLVKDKDGDSVLTLCAEYGCSWVLPAFIGMHGREAKLLEDPVRAHEYAVILLALWGHGKRVKELVDEGIVSFSADEALELLDNCAYNFGNMKEPVETFELLESLILKG